jgi:tetratricopeptide (TPR) repeat protein
MEVASLYLYLGLPQLAIPEYDHWIAAHEEDVMLPRVLHSRCWARALVGIELQKALEDCNSALKAEPDSANALDSRALVYLRMDKLDKALDDYNNALRIDPKAAWSLYGRGLIELRRGAAKDGAADIAAAKVLRATIEDDAKRYGIVR